MTSKDHLKLELMVYAVNADVFGYGSQCYKRSDGKWISIVDGERFEQSGKELADNFDTLPVEEQKLILDYYFDEVLKGGTPINTTEEI